MHNCITCIKIFVPTFLRTPSRTRSRIAGTAAIIVGANTEASPLVPLFILFDVSVSVSGEPYPILPPIADAMLCGKRIRRLKMRCAQILVIQQKTKDS